jgi:hypothetical protein
MIETGIQIGIVDLFIIYWHRRAHQMNVVTEFIVGIVRMKTIVSSRLFGTWHCHRKDRLKKQLVAVDVMKMVIVSDETNRIPAMAVPWTASNRSADHSLMCASLRIDKDTAVFRNEFACHQ